MANDALGTAVFADRDPLELHLRVVRQRVHDEAAHLAHDGEAEVVVPEGVDVQREEVREAGKMLQQGVLWCGVEIYVSITQTRTS